MEVIGLIIATIAAWVLGGALVAFGIDYFKGAWKTGPSWFWRLAAAVLAAAVAAAYVLYAAIGWLALPWYALGFWAFSHGAYRVFLKKLEPREEGSLDPEAPASTAPAKDGL